MTDPSVFVEQVGNILKFTGATRPEPDAVFILILGATGSGKTTFVSKCSGKSLEIGHDLSSCTSELTITSFPRPSSSKTIYLLDTPGFDDTNRSDSETLTHIAHYLAVAYANGIFLSGVILMHRIIDPRLSGTARLNLAMFKQMLGETAYENVAVVTSMWSDPPADLQVQRERELTTGNGILGEVLTGGGRAFRYSAADIDVDVDGRASVSPGSLPLAVVDHILHQARAGPVTLQIQSELVDDNRELIDTSAGRFLADWEVLGLRREYDAAMRGIRDGISVDGNALFALQAEDSHSNPSISPRVAQIHTDTEFADLEKKLKENHAGLCKTLIQMHHDEERRLAVQMAQIEEDLNARIVQKQQYLDALSSQSPNLNSPFAPGTVNPSPEVNSSTELEILHLRHEIQQLRLEIEQKQAANNSVRHAFRDGLLFDTVGRVIGSAVATAVPALVAGSLCALM